MRTEMVKKRSRKRANSEGTIYRRKSDGLFVAAVTAKGGKRLVGYARTQDAAKLKLEELKLRRNVPASPRGTYTVHTWVEKYIAARQVSDSTRNLWKSALKNQIKPNIGHIPLHRLTDDDVDDWLIAMTNEGVGNRIRQVAFDLLRAALKIARRRRRIRKNPTNTAARPQANRKDLKPFAIDEIKSILAAVHGDREELVYWLAFGVGLRQGEIFGLKLSSIDLKNCEARIFEQAVERKDGVAITRPKTKKSIRTVKLSPPVIDAIHRRIAIAMEEGLAGCELVCPSPEGKPWRRTNFARRHWKPLLDRLGLAHRGLHHARHSAATVMLRSGVAMHIVSAVVGHANTSTTVDIYGHVLAGDDVVATSIIADQITPDCNSVATGELPALSAG